MKHIFVMNPVSGVKNQIEEIKQEVTKYLSEDEVIFYETKGNGDATTFVNAYIVTHPEEHTRFYQNIKTACLIIRLKIFGFVWHSHFIIKNKVCKYFLKKHFVLYSLSFTFRIKSSDN